jgi:hypothetical protein
VYREVSFLQSDVFTLESTSDVQIAIYPFTLTEIAPSDFESFDYTLAISTTCATRSSKKSKSKKSGKSKYKSTKSGKSKGRALGHVRA